MKRSYAIFIDERPAWVENHDCCNGDCGRKSGGFEIGHVGAIQYGDFAWFWPEKGGHDFFVRR
jgi:hypothetical protein